MLPGFSFALCYTAVFIRVPFFYTVHKIVSVIAVYLSLKWNHGITESPLARSRINLPIKLIASNPVSLCIEMQTFR